VGVSKLTPASNSARRHRESARQKHTEGSACFHNRGQSANQRRRGQFQQRHRLAARKQRHRNNTATTSTTLRYNTTRIPAERPAGLANTASTQQAASAGSGGFQHRESWNPGQHCKARISSECNNTNPSPAETTTSDDRRLLTDDQRQCSKARPPRGRTTAIPDTALSATTRPRPSE
jgi:Neuraminidase (sialidase)